MGDRATIRVQIMAPVDVEIEVSWNEHEDAADIHEIRREMTQHGITQEQVVNQPDPEFLDYLDDLAAKKLGVVRGCGCDAETDGGDAA